MSDTLDKPKRSSVTSRWAKPLNLAIAIAGLSLLIGLRIFLQQPEQHGAMRWRTINDAQQPVVRQPPALAVYSVPNTKPAHALPTLKDLAEGAQVEAIREIEKASPQAHPWEDLRKALIDTMDVSGKDPFLFDRVLVTTVSRSSTWLPGDRMVRTHVIVEPINFKFDAYTVAATENETVKVSSVETTSTRKTPSDIGLTVPGLGDLKIGGLPDDQHQEKATSAITSQYEQLGVDISSDKLDIQRESETGGDVVGNTRVVLSMTTDADQILKMDETSSALGLDPEIVLAVTNVDFEASPATMHVVPLVPLPHCPLRAWVRASFDQRYILEGREFYAEGQQKVAIVHDDEARHTVDLAGADDVSPFVWSIQFVGRGEKPDPKWGGGTRRALHARAGGMGAYRRLVFSDYGQAVELAHWVRTHPNAPIETATVAAKAPVGSATTHAFTQYFFNTMGSPADRSYAVIKHTANDCGPERFLPKPEEETSDNGLSAAALR